MRGIWAPLAILCPLCFTVRIRVGVKQMRWVRVSVRVWVRLRGVGLGFESAYCRPRHCDYSLQFRLGIVVGEG